MVENEYPKIERPSKDEYYLSIAEAIAKRSACLMLRGGAVIIKDDQIIAQGYIGAPRKTPDCLDRGFCIRRREGVPSGHRYELCRSVHAEKNAIINAARAGVSVLGGTMYLHLTRIYTGEKLIDSFPCYFCKKELINTGLEKIVCSTKEGSFQIFKIQDWVDEWQDTELLDDLYRHDGKYEEK